MCKSGEICIPADCCRRELALYKNQIHSIVQHLSGIRGDLLHNRPKKCLNGMTVQLA
jgi:hypothetical protein